MLRSRIAPLLFSSHVIGATNRALADSAPASHVADFQRWNELDLSSQMSRRTQLTFALLERWSANLAEPSTYATGIDMNLEMSRFLSLTSSYCYSQSQTQAGHWVHSHLPLLAVAPDVNCVALDIETECCLLLERICELPAVGTALRQITSRIRRQLNL